MKRAIFSFLLLFAACGGTSAGGPGDHAPAVDAGGVSPTACGAAITLGEACHAPVAPESCACGNGVVDAPGQDCDVEQCDGRALAGKTCSTLGFAAGALACDPACTLDTRGCDACAGGAKISSCASAVASAYHARRLAVDAGFDGVALAWADDRGKHVALLDRDLRVRAESACIGGADGGDGVAIAATPTGWVAAFATGSDVDIFSLDACGQPRGAPRRISGEAPFLASRRQGGDPVGGPLFAWTAGGIRSAVLLREDGTEETASVDVPDRIVSDEAASAIFLGDAFLYAERRYAGASGYDSTVDVVRIGLDGKIAAQSQPVGTSTEFPVLATVGDTIVLTYFVYGSSTPSSEWIRLDTSGRAVGAPTLLPTTSGWQVPILAVGSSLRAVVRDDTSVRAVALDGATSDIALVKGVTTPASALSVRDGADAVFAWLGPSGEIGVSRTSP